MPSEKKQALRGLNRMNSNWQNKLHSEGRSKRSFWRAQGLAWWKDGILALTLPVLINFGQAANLFHPVYWIHNHKEDYYLLAVIPKH